MRREYLWALLTLIVAIALAFILLSIAKDDASSKVGYDCVDPTERERVRQLAFDGIDQGLVSAMSHLFDVWTKDPQNSQPQRAQVGTTNAVNAHIRARKLAFAWDPPPCAKEP